LVTCNSGDKHEADAVCLALPAHQPARLLALVDAALARELEEVHYSSVGTLNLAYRRADVRHPLNGSGFVVPAVEKRSILACTFSSQKFAGRTPEGCVLLRAFIGGAMAPQQLEGDDATLVERVRDDLREFLGITAPPLFHDLNRYSNAMAQYTVGHLKRVARIRELAKTHNGLFLAGNGFQGVGIPDCIHTGEEAAEQLYSASAVQLR
jgi:oxygen-dependent protoporphyrinogen oxidase